LSEEAAAYLVHRLPRDLHSLFAVLDRLDEASLAAQRRLTIPFLREALEARPAQEG
jgi:DnaA family protein